MWIFTTQGFYSAVQHRDDPEKVIVRGRTPEDIEALKAQIPTLEPFEDPSADYRYRAVVDKTEWVKAVEVLAGSIDYPNFKSAVARLHGHQRAQVYGRVWGELLKLQDSE